MKRRVSALIFIVIATVTSFVVHKVYVANKNPLLASDVAVDNHIVSYQKLFDKSWHIIKNEYYDPSMNSQHWNRWKSRYQNKIMNADDAKVALDSMIASLNDPYSRYLDADEFLRQNTTVASKICGIGVTIVSSAGKIKIINVLESTPAQFADLRSDDIILSVDGKKVSGMSLAAVSGMVKGEENTPVIISILRGKQTLTKRIIRKEITIKTVKSSKYDNIGYIQIFSFISKSTPSEFLEALENTSDSEGLIIDLRGNTGGLLSNAVFISNLFINNGKLVSIVGRNNYRYDVMAQDTSISIDKPVVLLIDCASASASEIFSGAMKDYNKAKLIGTKTYGKGMVQKIIPMPNKTGLNLTIARYLTPSGTDINKKGITPDIEISPKNITTPDNDIQLETAKNILNNLISRINN